MFLLGLIAPYYHEACFHEDFFDVFLLDELVIVRILKARLDPEGSYCLRVLRLGPLRRWA